MTEKHEETNQALVKAQGFWQKYQKPVLIVVTAIVVVLGGWFGYNEYILKPKEEKAADALFKAQEYFAMDSSKLVLDGDGQSKGVLYVLKNYSGTKAANLCNYYAGVSYLKLGDFNNAVKYLKDFTTDAKQVQLMAYGCLGDAYAELNKKEEAVESYKKAAHTFEKDESNSAEYLFRAALLQESAGKTKEALDLYKELKEKFPRTEKGFQADKYIYRLSIEKN
ncbi:MAG: tetratricopeptide repeat protein [Chitinophagaceae bacterium]|nr:tetratricopeptide repeat protein [Chitinophagaceae bacterium]MCA6453110.1 tetratricopeptide repeat protein [Chitinophagaceae bacterium]MCA6455211.1 tetratricopeptide repeat protein [Chitinophagaceae bacterium]MCA6460672.1 tetratricopeptide repeat protein [Chitinophagaceae bacterium]MCA6464928.1 tetratricopeptide repeat protein [Chitinophagaceae bacterium]